MSRRGAGLRTVLRTAPAKAIENLDHANDDAIIKPAGCPSHPCTGLGTSAIRVEYVLSKYETTIPCIVITNSYQSGNKKPEKEHIDKLRDYFGFGRKEEGKIEPYDGPDPLWWLDSRWCHWQWYNSFRRV
ncbi:hypothetical protein CC1G_15767 [Coprinopsis cinerea okayama7|uniref:Uncharacterized protein n=1 Tax=Coprinopsis cinerea (strain Okayama-7 / 130 / ATCC MYA-4618 / FGSC 9003) TaxID=240176 RepID=D6RQY1_COPC7|nr:hypothetical protein CC1G_15767 [Coprinopsis cinerea okayama7\|eukprot:XP_002910048.1 hypothetical protein CC1G_15767 [Coprinopsis cinerea okayama7\